MRKAYPSDLTDAQWAIIKPLIPVNRLGRPRLQSLANADAMPRLTVGRLMLAVAVVGLVVGLGIEGERRRRWYSERADLHMLKATMVTHWTINARRERHERLWRKYERAARRPWSAVETDEPEPE